MIREEDINRLLDCWARDVESIPEWCRRHDVDEAVIRRLAAVYGFNRQYAVFAIDAFRLGHEARRSDEPRAEPSPGREGSRYAVEFVVIDRDDGRIVGAPTPSRRVAEGLAGTYNEIDGEPSQTSRKA